MNFIFISPYFPHTYWQFCDRLHQNGVNVLGIGDAPYDSLEQGLKNALNTGWSRTPGCARISTSLQVFSLMRSTTGSINLP